MSRLRMSICTTGLESNRLRYDYVRLEINPGPEILTDTPIYRSGVAE
jgi:hypothetical protein